MTVNSYHDLRVIPRQTRRSSPVYRRPSTAEAPPIGKIHPFSKMSVTFEPLIGFWCPSGFPEDVLKKNINTPQFARLERTAETHAEEAKVETKKQQTFQHIQIMRQKKHPLILKKPHFRPKTPKIQQKKLNILLKKQRSYYWKPKKDCEEAIAKLKLEAEKAKAILKKHKEATKKVNRKK